MNNFKDYLIFNGHSHTTARIYAGRIKSLLQSVKVEDLTETTVNQWLMAKARDLSNSSRNSYIASVNAYLHFCKKEIALPKYVASKQKLPEYISEEFFDKTVLSLVDGLFPKDKLKIKTLLSFMFYTGLRRGEVVALHRTDFDLEKGEFKLMSKVGRERIMPLTPKLVALLKEYFEYRVEKRGSNAFNMTAICIVYAFRRLAKEIKDVNFHAHVLRNSFAHLYVRHGGDILSLCGLLGITVTEYSLRYCEIETPAESDFLKNKYTQYMQKESVIQQEPIISSTLVEEKAQVNNRWSQLRELVLSFIKALIELLTQKNVGDAQR